MSDDTIRIRAYFHWINRTGRQPDDPVSNWYEASEDEAYLASLPGRRRWPHIVIDQNKLRDVGVFDPDNGPFLLPDVAIAELFKSSDWRYVAERSLAHAVRRPDSVNVAHSIGHILTEELGTGELGELVDPVATARFREFLVNVASSPTNAFDVYARAIESARDTASTQHFDGLRNKQTVQNVRDAWLTHLKPADLRILRGPSGLESQVAHELLSDAEMLATIATMLKNADYPQATAHNLAYFPSLTGAHCLAMVALALQWIARGGLDGSTDEAILTNDLADIDYVVASLFCRGYISTERKMQVLRNVLRNALSSLWTRNAEFLLVATKARTQESAT